MSTRNAAVFLDRDGVLLEDRDLLVSPAELRVLPTVPEALRSLKKAGFQLVVVTNQAVVARGLIDEQRLCEIHDQMRQLLEEAGAPALDAVYYCPHHPEATLPAYRTRCECRKPMPGMILRAASEHHLNLPASFLVGDRMTDVAAGIRAGCRSILVRSGKHTAPPIVTTEPMDPELQPQFACDDLRQAAAWILEQP